MFHNKLVRYIAIIGICILGIVILGLKNFMFIKPINPEKTDDMRVGVIDGHISKNYDIIAQKRVLTYETKKTHGDHVLDFLMQYAPNLDYYYYDAEVENGLSTENILYGLEWMKDNDVNCVSVSLSSKYYSDKLETWIEDNRREIKVYASYNNELNSMDYPAMYKGAIGIGSSKKINSKKSDVIFHTNKIIMIGNGINYYHGNSYLTPYTMIKENSIQ